MRFSYKQSYCEDIEYFCHTLSEDLTHDADVFRQVKCLYTSNTGLQSEKISASQLSSQAVMMTD